MKVPDFLMYRMVLFVSGKNMPNLPIAPKCLNEIGSIY